jgi:predicted amino acid racemase
MAAQPTIIVDLVKVTENTERVLSDLSGIDLVAVTKVTCGSPEVAQAMLDGGATALGDSRLENVARLRDAGIEVPIWLLRAPTPGIADEVVRLTDISLESELETVKALNRACRRQEKSHGIIAMVELGDLREGMMPDQLPLFLDKVGAMEGVYLAGIGVSLTCFGGIAPSEENLGRLAALATEAEKQLDKPLLVSGGNSGSLSAVMSGIMPPEVNTLRVGETILFGVDTLTRNPIPTLHRDVFTVMAPVIECKMKPSKPTGVMAQDAFGNQPVFKDRGDRRRAICALGRQDAPPEGLVPVDARVELLGASSDHLVLDVDALMRTPIVGESIPLRPNYAAALALFTSPYVRKVYTTGE